MFNSRAAAFFNSNLFSMKSPFLTAASVKRTLAEVPPPLFERIWHM